MDLGTLIIRYMNYNRHDNDFLLKAEDSAILGFQQVLTDRTKVFVWFKQKVTRPINIDRHRTTREMNNTSRTHTWAKSVWKIDMLFKHLSIEIFTNGLTRKDFENLSNDETADKWITADGTKRNFIKCLILNPQSQLTKEPLNIQITQQAGQAFPSIYSRAREESLSNLGNYKELLNKYKDRSTIRTYAHILNGENLDTRLKEVYVNKDGINLRVYEETELVWGEPGHLFEDYKVAHELPEDIYVDYIQEVETTSKGIKEKQITV